MMPDSLKPDLSAKGKLKQWYTKRIPLNGFEILILLALMIRAITYIYFGSLFLIDTMLIVSVVVLLISVTRNLSKRKRVVIKDEKPNNMKVTGKVLGVLFATVLLFGLYLDTFIGIRDVVAIVQSTDERSVTTFDMVENGRRYFTTSSEDAEKLDSIPVYVVKRGKIVDSYRIETKTGYVLDDNGEYIPLK